MPVQQLWGLCIVVIMFMHYYRHAAVPVGAVQSNYAQKVSIRHTEFNVLCTCDVCNCYPYNSVYLPVIIAK